MAGLHQFNTATPPRVFTGTVVDIYADKGTIDIKVDLPESGFYSSVPYASAFKDNGLAGFDFVPTRGCRVLLLESPSQESGGTTSMPIVIGFTAPPGKSIGARTDLLPSDVQVQGKYGNNLLLRSNGDVYLVGDTQNLIAFISAKELTKVRSANYEHEHAGGRVTWTVDGEAVGGAVAYLHTIKRNSSDDAPYLYVAAGTSASGGLEVRVATEGGEVPAANPLFINDVPLGCAFKFSVDEMGHTGISALGALTAESVGPLAVSSSSGILMSAPQIAFTSAAGGMSMSSEPNKPMKIVIPEGIEIVTPSFRITQEEHALIRSDTEDESKNLVTVDLLDWVLNHRHLIGAPTATGALGVSPTGSISSAPIASNVTATDNIATGVRALISSAALLNEPNAVQILALIQQVESLYSVDKDNAQTKETKAR